MKAELEIELLHEKIDQLREKEVLNLTQDLQNLTDLIQNSPSGRPPSARVVPPIRKRDHAFLGCYANLSSTKSGYCAVQTQRDTRSVALDPVLKAHVMSMISQRVLRSGMAGYWAVEIRLSEAAGPGKRYLVHATDDHSAADLAGHLMGSALNVRGFDYFWIEPKRLERTRSPLPPLGRHQEVAGPDEWMQLMGAHDASEAAHPERGGA